MKKLLAIMLVVVLAATLFAGCEKTTNTVSPSANPDSSTTPGISPAPTTSVEVAEKYIPTFDGIIEFNTFNESDYQARWEEATKEYLLEKYKLKVANSVPGITGYEDTANVVGGDYMSSEAKRLEYNTKLALLFQSPETTPDFFTSLYASNSALDAPWLEFSAYLVDLSPYLEKDGPLYNGYLNWVWADHQDYWETFKSYLETEDGELFVLPRREKMPIRTFLGWNMEALKAINVDWNDKATDWDTMVSQLKAYKVVSGNAVALQSYCGNINDLLKFVASTYGLDFNDDFSWTTKNGEPLWTYCWKEYLDILTDINTLAQEHLVYNDNSNNNLVLGYNLNPNDSSIKRVAGNESKWGRVAGNSGLLIFAREDRIKWLHSSGESWSQLDTWHISESWITHNGYNYSLYGSSEFDIDYIAIGNRINKARGDNEFALRICQYLSEFMSDDGLITYQWGQRGVPFADTVDEAGSWEYIDIDGEQKVLFTGIENRFSWTKESAQPGWNAWFWEGRSDNWYAENLDPHYEQYIKYITDSSSKYTAAPYKESNAEEIGITDTGCWDNFLNWRRGIYFFGDVTAYPMQLTAYWKMESMSKSKPIIDKIIAECTSNNAAIYNGFFRSTSYVLGNEAAAMNDKISSLKKVAKDFTKSFLGGKAFASDWTSYIKNLEDLGYYDVYDYYKLALEECETQHLDSIISQSDVNKNLGKEIVK